MNSSRERPLLSVWPALRAKVPWADLGEFPTPVQSLSPVFEAARLDGEAWIKRDDRSSPIYGGNKVRTLEVLLGEAQQCGADIVYSTGAFGSNHALAAALHAERLGLSTGALLFPQPRSDTAIENLRVTIAKTTRLVALPHWSFLPFAMAQLRSRRGERSFVMVPGGATPVGALGYVSAAFEVAEQVRRGELPCPREVILGVGSTCTSAGLLLGFDLAAQLGIGFVDDRGHPTPPRLVAVRVTPWPVTSPIRIVRLAVATSRLLADLVGDPKLLRSYRELRPRLEVNGQQLGRGYGYATESGRAAMECFRAIPDLILDTTYSGKAAAGLMARAAITRGPLLFWSTKSTGPLPNVASSVLETAPLRMRRWLADS